MNACDGASIPPNLNISSIPGQGSEVEFRVDNQLYAGIGVAFSVPLGERSLMVRPSVDYFRQWFEVSGEVATLEEVAPDDLVERRVSGSADDAYDAVGPRLALDVFVVQRGPIRISLYAQTQFYFILGDLFR